MTNDNYGVNMTEESNILKIVEEDVLRILGEEESEKVSLESIKSEIKVSNLFLFNAIKELERENLIRSQEDFVLLTKRGRVSAKNIVKKHLVLEDYFKKTRSEREAHETTDILEHYISKEIIDNIKKLSTFKERGIPLTELKLYKESIIADITIPNNELFERIVSMGIFPGERIRLIAEIPNGIIVEIKNKKFALGKDIVKEIQVLEYEKF